MADAPLFEIEDVHVSTPSAETDAGEQRGGSILKGVSLTIDQGEVHALIGPNGAGKSTLARALLGSPDYKVTSGRIRFRGDDITDWATDVRGKAGLFLAFQRPPEIPGVSVLNLLRQALSARKGTEMSVLELRLALLAWMERLSIEPSFMERAVNEGFSGSERKRNEILQMVVLEPEMAILDETDSLLDIDALKTVVRGVRAIMDERPTMGTLAITHDQRLLDLLQPDQVHILIDGRLVAPGGTELASRLADGGYES
ncbi:MAG: Fe-S cluster assembly ATPase SufC, partial [Acidimicrobiia bacterium]|nr:Fe-S cluster assembly ATPase SufC [Acidimicrobiia bacterium]